MGFENPKKRMILLNHELLAIHTDLANTTHVLYALNLKDAAKALSAVLDLYDPIMRQVKKDTEK